MSIQDKVEFFKNALSIILKVLESVIKIVDVIADKIGDNSNAL